MIRYLIKNNFKLMFRNTWSIIVMLTGPVLVIAILTSAFSELMKSYEGVDEFAVGYRVEEGVDSSGISTAIKSYGDTSGIIFHEYPEGEPADVMKKNKLAGFVEFSGEEYTVYKSEDYEVEGITLEYFMKRIMDGIRDAAVPEGNTEEVMLPTEELEFMPAVNAVDYYGIVYIVYFSWCGIICAAGVLSNEKKYGIAKRFQVTGMSEIRSFIGKYIPVNLTVMAGMLLVTLITIPLFQVHWGNPPLSALIMFVMILAGNALGMMIYGISDNLAITVIVQFMLVWFMGFFGGSFETYMFSSMPDILKQLSPIYHINRALVEISCMGKSGYTISAVGYSLGITAVCSAISILAGSLRKRGRA